MMNLDVSCFTARLPAGHPRPDEAAGHRRRLLDEVEPGLTIAPGGATHPWGVTPDLVTLAKALGGGSPIGAIGGTEEAMACVEDGSVYQVGTYNGNPLGMAATRANLLEVLTPAAYVHLDRLTSGSSPAARRSSPGTTSRATRWHRLQGLRHLLPDEGHRLRDLQGQPGHGALRPRLALQHEPRHLHDARPRRGMDPLGHPHPRGRRRLRPGLRGDGRRPRCRSVTKACVRSTCSWGKS